MKALVFDGTLHFASDYPRPSPPPGEALVRVLLAGICNTDLEIIKGYMGFRGVLGHEFVGMVVEAPDAALVGKRVVGEINAWCGDCPTCRAGRPTHCPHRTTLGIYGRDGAFAEFLTLPQRNLHLVPDGVSNEAAVFVEPLAASLEILEQVHVRPTHRVAVLGDGKLGLLVAQVLALTGCDLTVAGHHAAKLAFLARKGIATTTRSPEGQFDVVVECTGQAAGFELARRLVRPRGILVLKSTFAGTQEVALAPLVVDEVTLVGSRCGPFAPALRLLAGGLVDTSSLISAVYPLEEGLEAMERARQRGTLKVLLRTDA